ncbi:MAG: bifunctional folylpolyglutamate synthase/dihydrofolate synthase, partial [Acidimicrobiales bacterium]
MGERRTGRLRGAPPPAGPQGGGLMGSPPGTGDPLAYLEAHAGWRPPARRSDGAALARTRRLLDELGRPQDGLAVLHVTGTNGKTSTARIASRLLEAAGLQVGTFTSPHLQGVTERVTLRGSQITEEELGEAVGRVAAAERSAPRSDELAGQGPGFFEILTVAALWHLARAGADAVVLEAGIGGRWDATNVVDSRVAVVTNVAMDHVEVLGPTLADIAWEKAGIAKPGGVLVQGETSASLEGVFARAATEAGVRARVLRGRDFGDEPGRPDGDGRLVRLWTPAARYEELWLGLRGAHQAANAAAALAAVEAFRGVALPQAAVAAALAGVSSPGRLERVGERPCVLLDGVK